MRNDETLMRNSACGLIIDSLFFPFLLFPFSFLLSDKRAYIDIVGRELEGQKGRVPYFYSN